MFVMLLGNLSAYPPVLTNNPKSTPHTPNYRQKILHPNPQPINIFFNVWHFDFHTPSTNSPTVRQYAFHTQTMFLIVKNATAHQAQLRLHLAKGSFIGF
jgi:hypothetical protein